MWTHPAEGVAPYYDANSTEGNIYRLYRAYFLREPDTSGFEYWYVDAVFGDSLDHISETFAKSSEFVNRYGDLSNGEFVDLVYTNVLGRPPDSSGRSYWTDRMDAGLSRGRVMRYFADSSEYKRKTGLGVPPAWRAGSNALALLDTVTVEDEHLRDGYSEDLFPHWDDLNHNGCDTRCEVLKTDKRSDGTWFSYWDGIIEHSSSDIDIDHVVALAEAWDSGADLWDIDQREAFANWQTNLIAVGSSINESKSDQDAAEWSPPRSASRCLFAEVTVTTKAHWGLSVDTAERDALDSLLTGCTKHTSDPPAPTTTTTTRPPTTRPPTTTTTTRPAGCFTASLYLGHHGECLDKYAQAHANPNCPDFPASLKPIKVINPSDPWDLDRDGDGLGCE
ncbi:MAG: DUF4214 domain-containing protein [Acidimicrobiia bacterium]|nr:DUF4214 domain-containing protein [Acidimicrobiia bacterium]